MKKLIVVFALALTATASFAQSEKYTNAMKTNIALIDSAFAHPANFISLANTFERIGTAEKTQWLPYYYAAYCQVNAGLLEKDNTKVDGIADKATDLIAKADSLSPNNSEISCVKSMIATAHMKVNPMQRYMQYGEEISSELADAIKQDPTNPRPNMIKGQNLKFTPEQFGGGCKTAKPELQTAADKFAAFKPASDIAPGWGKAWNDKLLADCK